MHQRPAANWATPPKNAAISNIVAGDPVGVPHQPRSHVLTTIVEAKNPNRPSVAGGAIGVRAIRAGGAPFSCGAPSLRGGASGWICATVRPSSLPDLDTGIAARVRDGLGLAAAVREQVAPVDRAEHQRR